MEIYKKYIVTEYNPSYITEKERLEENFLNTMKNKIFGSGITKFFKQLKGIKNIREKITKISIFYRNTRDFLDSIGQSVKFIENIVSDPTFAKLVKMTPKQHHALLKNLGLSARHITFDDFDEVEDWEDEFK